MPPWMTCLRGWPRPFRPFISVVQSVRAFYLIGLLCRTGSGKTTFTVGAVVAAAAVRLHFCACANLFLALGG